MRRPIAIACAVLVAGACQAPAGTAHLEGTPPPTASPTAAASRAPTASPLASAELFAGRLLFSRFDEGSHTNLGSFVARSDGSQEAELPLPWEEGANRWSRSGAEISVVTQLADGRVGTAIIDATGTVLRVLEIADPTLNLACGPWSIDDSRLACEGWDESDRSRSGIYTVRASDGSDIQRLTTPPDGSTDIPGDFSPDGQLVFKRGPAEVEGSGPLMLVDGRGGEPTPIGTGSFEDPGRFSPDGDSIATSVDGGVVVLDVTGQALGRIAEPGAFLFGPAWAPDGTHLVYSRTAGGFIADLVISLPDGTDLQQITRTPQNEINVDWGVDPG